METFVHGEHCLRSLGDLVFEFKCGTTHAQEGYHFYGPLLVKKLPTLRIVSIFLLCSCLKAVLVDSRPNETFCDRKRMNGYLAPTVLRENLYPPPNRMLLSRLKENGL